MAYTIGTSHGPFTGTGSFVIAKPAGIRTIVTNIPAWTGHENESPRRYFRLGRFTLGNSHGFSESQLLEYAQQLAYPIAPIWELLAYDINDGASCTFYELVDVPVLSGLQPWDRTPLHWARSSAPYPGGGTVTSQAWTYTVPTGRRLMLSNASAAVLRDALPTTGNAVSSNIMVDGTVIVQAQLFGGVRGSVVSSELSAGPLYLAPGQVVTATYFNADSGGWCSVAMMASGLLFDA